ncbi:hypothetical protein M0811_09122 [Anaeramoeba ignava]|uniref:F5/8 type C domain-containing protein n=1 Tax=Anaeramoeba ignava TaxID=1746090 RepID=A0A9Q0RAD7_ANAIG|nr:hypothetical protein M0811_09122 [Anaeramoeba ignava]
MAVRFVKIQHYRNEYLHVSQVEVLTFDGKNIALGKKATQSSVYSHSKNPIAERAVDGNTETDWNRGNLTHTNQEKSWLLIDLGQNYPFQSIHRINVYNRTDCCNERLEEAVLYLLDDHEKELFSNVLCGAMIPQAIYVNKIENVKVRKVKIEHIRSEYLHVSQVEVLTFDGKNIALGKKATQSSVYSHSKNPIAERAVDGNTETDWNRGNLTHTNQEKSWLLIDLEQEYLFKDINKIITYNRSDGCNERLSGAILQIISSDNFVIWHSTFNSRPFAQVKVVNDKLFKLKLSSSVSNSALGDTSSPSQVDPFQAFQNAQYRQFQEFLQLQFQQFRELNGQNQGLDQNLQFQNPQFQLPSQYGNYSNQENIDPYFR